VSDRAPVGAAVDESVVPDFTPGGDVLSRVASVAQRALREYDPHPEARVELINVSENATFAVEGPELGRAILRVHRLGYHGLNAIESELAWMEALRSEAGIPTPAVLPAGDGHRVVTVTDSATGDARHCVLFERLGGSEPAQDDASRFEQLGALTARMHRHARTWDRPAKFTRFRWDVDAAFGAAPRWGQWRSGAGVGPHESEVLGRLERTITRRLAVYGSGPDRFGLIHADTRLANLLVENDTVNVIDFDDCGFGWFLYDLGTSVSFFEHEAHVPALVDRWLRGYRSEAELSAADEDEIWTFIMLRRLLLVAWIGSHGSVDIAQELGAGYTEQSCDLAERYLGQYG
jgi:Ser/Thr protein kinase RdoA (MazF antagonist)